jgi:hypothetical protein
MITREECVAAEMHLAKLMGLRYCVEVDRRVHYEIGPRWTTNGADAFALLTKHLNGYFEAREGAHDHCIVIPNTTERATVVLLRDHLDKSQALAYAAVLAVTAKLEREAKLAGSVQA